MLKKADIVLIVILISLSFYFILANKKELGGKIVITVNGTVIGEYQLNEEREIDIIGDYLSITNDKTYETMINIAKIEGGSVFMKTADCHDGVCVRQGKVDKLTETIICLPNKVVIEVIQGIENEIDAISN